MSSDRCPICPARYRCVPGDGPSDAAVFCIGEAPGQTEDTEGRPFIGVAGKEFNENYLPLAGLTRDEIYITNTMRCPPDLNRKPTRNEAHGCAAHHLPADLSRVNPSVVLLMGGTPCSLLPDIDLESDHGIPRWGKLFDWEGWLVPINHPAAGLHDGAMMIPLLEDFEGLYGWLKYGDWPWPVDSVKRDYALIDTKVELEDYLHAVSINVPEPFLIGGDTETHNRLPYSWQVSLQTGVARMIMLRNREVCKELSDWTNAQLGFGDASFVFHNAPADLPIFEGELQFPLDGLYRDTMQEAYRFQNLRQGLKPLARRLLGRIRKSWEETVTPPSKEVLGAWMCEAFTYAESQWRRIDTHVESNRVSAKTGKPLKDKVTKKLIKSPAETVLADVYKYAQSNPDYDPWKKTVERLPAEWFDKVVAAIGPMPARGIAHCSIEDQIEYACSDPDDTRQLALLFDGLRRDFIAKLNVQPEDTD